MKGRMYKIIQKLFIPFIGIIILYCLFFDHLDEPYLFYIRAFILLLSFFCVVGGLFLLYQQGGKIYIYKSKSIKELIQKNSSIIVEGLFYAYFSLYLVLELDKKSLIYNYIVLLLFGLFLGVRIMEKKDENK